MDLNANERIEDLQLKDLRIIQNTEWFCFGIDAVLLSDFAEIKKNSTVVDLGTGTGIIPLLLWGKKEPKKIIGVEIQKEVADMASRSICLNNLENSIEIINLDMNHLNQIIPLHSIDVVVVNPPYVEFNGGNVNPKSNKAISRHEISCSLEDVVRVASGLLRHSGSFFMVHRPHRLVDIFCLMRKYKVEPKTIRFVHPKAGQQPNMVLVKGVKAGNSELKIKKPLFVHGEDGQYTDEIFEIYGMERK
ncbi:MAG: Methyltransferase small [Clostridiales bacterium 38_11]|nr:MAG: Methyltransferase small [Clostridiales bacterium 38_11]HBH12292.1 SAM-dependent methyltransferase [Clostridiales bacterium]